MKQDIFFYMQFVMLALNVIVFIYLMLEHKLKYKFARVALLIVVSIGFFFNLGKLSWFFVLFCFAPFLALLNFKHERFNRIAKTGRDIIGSRDKHLQKLSGGHKAIVSKKA